MNPYELPMQKTLVTIQRFGEIVCSSLKKNVGVDDEHIDEILNHLVSVNAIGWCTNYRVRFIYEAPLHHAISIACPFCDVNITDDNMSMATDVKGNPICSACFERNGDKCQRCDALVERTCQICGDIQIISLTQRSRFPICFNCAAKIVGEKNKGRKQTAETIAKIISATPRGKLHYNYGKTLPASVRAKISLGNTGRIVSDETRAKMSIASKGRKITPETRKKMSIAQTGKKKPDGFGAAISDRMKGVPQLNRRGENSGNWRGGISFEPYCPKFNKSFKESIRNKFDRKCFICGMSEEDNNEKLSVHHVSYDKNCLCGETKCEFVPLCRVCHLHTNKDRDVWERLLMDVLVYEGYII